MAWPVVAFQVGYAPISGGALGIFLPWGAGAADALARGSILGGTSKFGGQQATTRALVIRTTALFVWGRTIITGVRLFVRADERGQDGGQM
jgi:hypothetical protein